MARFFFQKTDVFIVEIASKICYEANQSYYHHVAYDSPSTLLNKNNKKNKKLSPIKIRPRIQDNEEIKRDLDVIIKLLGAEKVIFVTHFYTRENSSRAELAKDIEMYLKNSKIAVINPTKLLDRWSEKEVFISEEILSHYSPIGHELISEYYRKEIIKLISSLKKRTKNNYLIQVIDNTQEKVEMMTAHGLGDSLLGAAFIFQKARELHRVALIDWSYFSAAKWLKIQDLGIFEKNSSLIGSPKDRAEYIFHSDGISRLKKAHRVYTNKRPRLPLEISIRDSLIRSGINPGEEIRECIENFFELHNLKDKEFAVLHIRFKDENEYSDILEIKEIIEKAILAVKNTNQNNMPIVLISNFNSNLHLKDLEENNANVIIKESKSTHLGTANDENEEIQTLADFFLVDRSFLVYTYSEYDWISGFSLAASAIFDVPLVDLKQISHK